MPQLGPGGWERKTQKEAHWHRNWEWGRTHPQLEGTGRAWGNPISRQVFIRHNPKAIWENKFSYTLAVRWWGKGWKERAKGCCVPPIPLCRDRYSKEMAGRHTHPRVLPPGDGVWQFTTQVSSEIHSFPNACMIVTCDNLYTDLMLPPSHMYTQKGFVYKQSLAYGADKPCRYLASLSKNQACCYSGCCFVSSAKTKEWLINNGAWVTISGPCDKRDATLIALMIALWVCISLGQCSQNSFLKSLKTTIRCLQGPGSCPRITQLHPEPTLKMPL